MMFRPLDLLPCPRFKISDANSVGSTPSSPNGEAAYDLCDDKTLSGLQTAANETTTHRHGAMCLRQAGLAGLTAREWEKGKLASHAKAPSHTDSAGCSASRRKLAGHRPCSRGRGHIGSQGISNRVCTGIGRNTGMACRRFRRSNHPANLRSATKPQNASR